MCLAKAFLKDSASKPLLTEIALVEAKDGKLLMRTLFGEQKEIAARIQSIDFMKSSIILEGSTKG